MVEGISIIDPRQLETIIRSLVQRGSSPESQPGKRYGHLDPGANVGANPFRTALPTLTRLETDSGTDLLMLKLRTQGPDGKPLSPEQLADSILIATGGLIAQKTGVTTGTFADQLVNVAGAVREGLKQNDVLAIADLFPQGLSPEDLSNEHTMRLAAGHAIRNYVDLKASKGITLEVLIERFGFPTELENLVIEAYRRNIELKKQELADQAKADLADEAASVAGEFGELYSTVGQTLQLIPESGNKRLYTTLVLKSVLAQIAQEFLGRIENTFSDSTGDAGPLTVDEAQRYISSIGAGLAKLEPGIDTEVPAVNEVDVEGFGNLVAWLNVVAIYLTDGDVQTVREKQPPVAKVEAKTTKAKSKKVTAKTR